MLELGFNWDTALILFAAFIAGGMNGVAGGGTNVSFPTLLWVGLSAVPADATNMFALLPASLGAAWGFRKEVARVPHWWYWFFIPVILGGITGAWFLIHLPPTYLKKMAPFMVLGAALLVGVEPLIKKKFSLDQAKSNSLKWKTFAIILLLIVSIYGGYFGAGASILMLVALGFLGAGNLKEANGLKNLFIASISAVSVTYFAMNGKVIWSAALPMGIIASLGGWSASRMARKVSEKALRTGIVIIGIIMAGVTYFRT